MASIWMVVLAFLAIMFGCEGSDLRYKFYKKSCPSAEDKVKEVVERHVAKDRTLAAALLRMHFHDCFVRGCDGSVLLNSTANNTAEKSAIPNLSLRGFDVIDDVKAEIEKMCPGFVSCADILALAARDAVVAGSGGPFWRVRTGRRDGVVSQQNEALSNIPSPFFNFSQLQASFASKGLSAKDLVVLSGGHTIGVGHCNLFSNRLYNFTGKGDTDPSLDPTYAQFLKSKCTSLADTTTTVEMDPNSSLTFDSHYFSNLQEKKGLFESDVALLTNSIAKKQVEKQMKGNSFFENFKNSMQQMSEIQVLTGTTGKIRRQCAFIN
ncbi:peroxidase 39-like [Cryptomeria japonica]|uniref:peroxidase 39-like n=1 Tax=Cryptomeria japonica TaxID=3369 RepID=UPI0027DA5466|nr:peroxidase 39-like [Cryptomeria japonica]